MNEIKKQKQLEHSYCHKLQSTNQLFKPPKTAAVLPMKQSVDAHVVGRVFPAMHLRLQMWGSESTLTKTIKLSNLASKDKRQILALLRNIGLLLNLEQNISMSQCHIYKFDWSQEDLQQVPASEPCMFWKDFSMVQRRFPTTSASSALAAFHTKQCYKKNACISFATITLIVYCNLSGVVELLDCWILIERVWAEAKKTHQNSLALSTFCNCNSKSSTVMGTWASILTITLPLSPDASFINFSVKSAISSNCW